MVEESPLCFALGCAMHTSWQRTTCRSNGSQWRIFAAIPMVCRSLRAMCGCKETTQSTQQTPGTMALCHTPSYVAALS